MVDSSCYDLPNHPTSAQTSPHTMLRIVRNYNSWVQDAPQRQGSHSKCPRKKQQSIEETEREHAVRLPREELNGCQLL